MDRCRASPGNTSRFSFARSSILPVYARRWDRHMEDVAANLDILADAQAIADVASFP